MEDAAKGVDKDALVNFTAHKGPSVTDVAKKFSGSIIAMSGFTGGSWFLKEAQALSKKESRSQIN